MNLSPNDSFKKRIARNPISFPRFRSTSDLGVVKIPKRREIYYIPGQGTWGDFYGNGYKAAPTSLTTSRDFTVPNTGNPGMGNSGVVIYPNGGVVVVPGSPDVEVAEYQTPPETTISLSTQLPGLDRPHCFGQLVQRDDAAAGYYQYITATEGAVRIEIRDTENHFLISTPLEMSTEKFNAASSVNTKQKIHFSRSNEFFVDSGTKMSIKGEDTAFIGALSRIAFEVARFVMNEMGFISKEDKFIPRYLYHDVNKLYEEMDDFMKQVRLYERRMLSFEEIYDKATRLRSFQALPIMTAGWIVGDVLKKYKPFSFGVRF